jgi:hypothetical protein
LFETSPLAIALLSGPFDKSSQLFDWLRVVINLEPHDYIVVQPHAAIFLYDEHRGRLHPSFIAPGRLPRFQGR